MNYLDHKVCCKWIKSIHKGHIENKLRVTIKLVRNLTSWKTVHVVVICKYIRTSSKHNCLSSYTKYFETIREQCLSKRRVVCSRRSLCIKWLDFSAIEHNSMNYSKNKRGNYINNKENLVNKKILGWSVNYKKISPQMSL